MVRGQSDQPDARPPIQITVPSVMDAVAGARQVQLALLLTESGAQFVVAGGTARLLRGENHTPRDLDLLVRRAEATQLRAVLQQFAILPALTRSADALPWTMTTSWSQVDVFVEDHLPAWHRVAVDGLELQVADERTNRPRSPRDRHNQGDRGAQRAGL